MESLEKADGKSNVYNECKYKVKIWEHEFKKQHKRLPSKLDIREASIEVRNAYKIYFRLKTAALEESLMNLDGFDHDVESDNNLTNKVDAIVDEQPINKLTASKENNLNPIDTWGIHLNKPIVSFSENKEVKTNINKQFTQKLFQGSKSSRRLPRKSLSGFRKKSDSSIKQQSLSQSETSTSLYNVDMPIASLSQNDVSVMSNFKTVTSTVITRSVPINLINGVENNHNSKTLRQLDPGWIDRLSQLTKVDNDSENKIKENTESDYDSDDIIENSEDEFESSCSVYHSVKKPKIGNEVTQSLDFSNIFSKSSVQPDLETEKLICNKTNKVITLDLDNNTNSKIEFSNIMQTRSRKSKNCNNFKESDAEINDPYYDDTDDAKDPEFTLNNKNNSNSLHCLEDIETLNKKKSLKNTEEKKIKKTRKSSVSPGLTSEVYELEYSVKPRTVITPRIKNIKQIFKSNKELEIKCDQVSKRQQQMRAKLEQKINSGTLNENYVQINLKKKIYARGKSKMNFSKYKKQQWKNKKKALCGPDMDMGGCDGGMLNCFNCGESGHFARTCPKGKSDSLLNNQVEELSLHPTLEEAAKMAKDSSLVIRKPNNDNFHNKQQDNSEFNDLDNGKFNGDDDIFSDEYDDELIVETQRLEEEIKKFDVNKYTDSTSTVQPYYQLTENGNLIDTPAEVFEALNKFGYNNFRTGQEHAIMRILSGKSTLVTLSTGSGKSLCYQLPAYLYSKRQSCISLIISPLVSLMEDQVTGIPKFLNAACLHNNQSKTQKDKLFQSVNSGKLDVLLVSPEAVVAGEKSSGFGSLLRKLPPIAFACIDEAHCVSQWSHNFRPSYLKICRVLKDRLGVNTILGLTATATRTTSDSIIKHFSILDGHNGIIQDIPLPDNLKLTISCDNQKDQALMSLLLSERYSECKSVIVYCTRRDECERVATFLRTSLRDSSLVNNTDSKKRKRYSLLAEPYHAGLSASRRKSIQKAFMSGDLRIVVATVAFGMGINKADLRSVIHYNMPMSFENYVQEVGRAGRDGLPAYCHLFLNPQGNDKNELLRHIYANSVDRYVIRKLLQKCFVPCSCKTTCPRHEVAFSIQETVQELDVPEENIETLLCYLELHQKRYIEVLSNAYITCKIISYGESNIINKASKDCAPLAMALALFRKKEDQTKNIFEFPIIDVASAIGWDSGICKHILKNLEWITVNGCPKRSQLNVQFSNLGFRLLSFGNLSDSELDEALDNLYDHVKEQERTAVLQLDAIHSTLSLVSTSNYKTCCVTNTENSNNENILKTKIREYFVSSKPLDILPKISEKLVNEEQIINDVRSLICMYRDNTFTGRAVARIFHGIQSPNYPALIWARCKFWRSHIGEDFYEIVQIATREILQMK